MKFLSVWKDRILSILKKYRWLSANKAVNADALFVRRAHYKRKINRVRLDISRNLVMAERNNKVKFSGFSREFFLMWFFPIGLWFIQPRINKLYEKNHH